MTLLHFAEQVHGDRIVLVDDQETLNYTQLLSQSINLAFSLKENVTLKSGQKVGLLCKNHASLVKSIFAVSRLGADVFLLNAEISKDKLKELIVRHDFDVLIYDFELMSLIEQSHFTKHKILSYHDTLPAVNNLLQIKIHTKQGLQRTTMSRLVLQTSGTTGNAKEAPHKPSLLTYLSPFSTLMNRLKLLNYNTAYIGTPIYHGYGIAILLVCITSGKKAVICRGFDSKKACALILQHQVEVLTVVPLMLDKLLKHNVDDLKSLACVASGGAKLQPRLINETFTKLGDVLYNLYGTSEAGLTMVATPHDLKYSTLTIGKKINGVGLKVLDLNMQEIEIGKVGQFCIKNKSTWIETGDLGYKDHQGYYFLCGRNDDMIVSGGENVYPIELEQVLIMHPLVEDLAVIGMSDEEFGQRLKAFVVVENTSVSEEELLEWLRSRTSRFQLPRTIIFVDRIPYTELGKQNKKLLKEGALTIRR